MKRKWRLFVIAPVVAGVVAAGAYATTLSLSGQRGTQLQSSADPEVDDVSGCQTGGLSVVTDYSAPLSAQTGFNLTFVNYVITGISPGCSGKTLSLAVNLDSTGLPECAAAPQLGNADFEQTFPGINWLGGGDPANGPGYKLVPQDTAGLYWHTTGVYLGNPDKIELWKSGFQGVTAPSGAQFAELNAFVAGTLYQDLPTTPGQTMRWSLRHHATPGSGATNTMRVLIGEPGGSLQQSGPNLVTGNTWAEYSGAYTVPAGQTTTRFAFQAVSPGGDAGNLLDNISFTTAACDSPGYQQVTQTAVLSGQSSVTLAGSGALPLSAESIKGYSIKIT